MAIKIIAFWKMPCFNFFLFNKKIYIYYIWYLNKLYIKTLYSQSDLEIFLRITDFNNCMTILPHPYLHEIFAKISQIKVKFIFKSLHKKWITNFALNPHWLHPSLSEIRIDSSFTQNSIYDDSARNLDCLWINFVRNPGWIYIDSIATQSLICTDSTVTQSSIRTDSAQNLDCVRI